MSARTGRISMLVACAMACSLGLAACAAESPAPVRLADSPVQSLAASGESEGRGSVEPVAPSGSGRALAAAPSRASAIDDIGFPFLAPALGVQLYSSDCELSDDHEPHGVCL